MRPLPLAVALLLPACRGSGTSEVRADPVDAAKVVDAPVTPPPSGSLDRFVLVAGQVVDLEKQTKTHELTKAPKAEAWKGTRGYVVGKDDVLRAYDLTTGATAWSATPAHPCYHLVAGERYAYCVHDTQITAFVAKDGSATPLPGTTKVGTAQLVETQDRTLVFTYAGVRRYDATLTALAATPVKFATLYPEPYATKLGPCLAHHRSPGGLDVACFTPTGDLRFQDVFPTAKPGDPTTWFQVSHHGRFVLATSLWGAVKRSVLVEVPTKGGPPVEAARLEESAIAPVVRADGSLEGLLTTRGKTIALVDPKGVARWTTPFSGFGETGRAALVGNTVVLAIFHTASSGCQLYGHDLATGKLLWAGDVLQLPIAHSAYSNDVDLEVRGDLVRLSGHEAGIRYEQLFEAATGKRVFAEAKMRW